MRALLRQASRVALRKSTVLLLGETGSGKEVVARHIHQSSERRDRPFIPVDCSALAGNLFESQLFGHRKGAFTGAMRDSLGFIRAADGGTLFLDEIGELSLPLQAKLLRVIQERLVVPVGDTVARAVNVRIVAATHRNLAEMVRLGQFREDLYFRLNVVQLQIPPLRQRVEGILPLANHFLNLQAELYGEARRTLSPEVKQVLTSHAWPGNVRELANVIEHAYVLADGQTIQLTDLPLNMRAGAVHGAMAAKGAGLDLLDVERATIAEALKRTRYRKTAASRLLGINVQRLNRRIIRLKIPCPR